MIFLINASNLNTGGALQVTDSICSQLNRFRSHIFVVVLSSYLKETYTRIEGYENVKVYEYNIKNSLDTILFGRDRFLDDLVIKQHVDGVLTIFGPSRWNPQVPHLSGYAFPHLVMHDSPYFSRMSIWEKIKYWLRYEVIVKYMLYRSTRYFWTENPLISERLNKLFKDCIVYTVTNYYNQVFDNPDHWKDRCLPAFNGCTLLTVTVFAKYKNLTISVDMARYLMEKYPNFNFRFVFTCNENDFPKMDNALRSHFVFLGIVNNNECPSLYNQCDIVFHPTLLECFTAVYPEAMRMSKPIITTDLEFAHGLCGDAAIYYPPLSPEAAAECVFNLYDSAELKDKLVKNAKKRLAVFDNYESRAKKLVTILTNISRNGKS